MVMVVKDGDGCSEVVSVIEGGLASGGSWLVKG